MATVATLGAQVRALLDDDASTSPRYTYDQDIIPAMNSAINYLVAVFTAGFEAKQIKPEVLHGLIAAKSFDVVKQGVIAKIDVSGLNWNTEVWRLLGVEPNPSLSEEEGEDLLYSVGKMAKRLTLEEWNHSQEDPFMRGSTAAIPTVFMEAAYTGPGRYFDSTKDHILLRPAELIDDGLKVAVYYLKNPTALSTSASTIEFPVSVHGLIVQKTVQYITYQHSSEVKYFQVTDKEVKELIALLNT